MREIRPAEKYFILWSVSTNQFKSSKTETPGRGKGKRKSSSREVLKLYLICFTRAVVVKKKSNLSISSLRFASSLRPSTLPTLDNFISVITKRIYIYKPLTPWKVRFYNSIICPHWISPVANISTTCYPPLMRKNELRKKEQYEEAGVEQQRFSSLPLNLSCSEWARHESYLWDSSWTFLCNTGDKEFITAWSITMLISPSFNVSYMEELCVSLELLHSVCLLIIFSFCCLLASCMILVKPLHPSGSIC